LLFISPVFSQQTDFSYKEKGKNQYSATLYFSDEQGGEDVAPENFATYEDVYFTVKTNSGSEKDYFKDGDIEDCFAEIKLLQNGKKIPLKKKPVVFTNSDEKISLVLLTFPKNEVKLYDPIVFVNDIDTSDAIAIRDKYFPSYNEYLPIYEEGMKLRDLHKYVDAYKKLIKVVKDAKTNEEIEHLGFYPNILNSMVSNAIIQKADTLDKLMEAVSLNFEKYVNKTGLRTMDSICDKMEEGKLAFTPYFEMGESKSKTCKETYLSKLDKVMKKRTESRELYKAKILGFLETGTYSEYKFSLYMNILVNMTTRLDTLGILSGLRELDMSTLDKMQPEKEELKMTNWYDDFQVLVEMLNMDIKAKGKFFNDKIIENLQRQKSLEPEPYLQIFLAFNELSGNPSTFVNYLKNALIYCTDEDLMLNMEMWVLSFNLSGANISSYTVEQMNKGIMFVDQQSWTEAEKIFSTITKQANTIAPPWFFLGKIQYKKDEIFTAEAKFNRALEIYPQYIAPRLFKFNMLYSQGRFEELIKGIDEAILINDIWLYHYWKAKSLYGLEKPKQVIAEIKEQCINLNPFSVEAYFLLGDAYVLLHEIDNAREAYQKTQEIDIYTAEDMYNVKMKALQEMGN